MSHEADREEKTCRESMQQRGEAEDDVLKRGLIEELNCGVMTKVMGANVP